MNEYRLLAAGWSSLTSEAAAKEKSASWEHSRSKDGDGERGRRQRDASGDGGRSADVLCDPMCGSGTIAIEGKETRPEE